MSPWDTKDSLCYFQGYTLEVGMDFYYPHDRAYDENYRFECHNPSATIWHEGPGNRYAKTVLRNCTSTNNDGFKLKHFPPRGASLFGGLPLCGQHGRPRHLPHRVGARGDGASTTPIATARTAPISPGYKTA